MPISTQKDSAFAQKSLPVDNKFPVKSVPKESNEVPSCFLGAMRPPKAPIPPFQYIISSWNCAIIIVPVVWKSSVPDRCDYCHSVSLKFAHFDDDRTDKCPYRWSQSVPLTNTSNCNNYHVLALKRRTQFCFCAISSEEHEEGYHNWPWYPVVHQYKNGKSVFNVVKTALGVVHSVTSSVASELE